MYTASTLGSATALSYEPKLPDPRNSAAKAAARSASRLAKYRSMPPSSPWIAAANVLAKPPQPMTHRPSFMLSSEFPRCAWLIDDLKTGNRFLRAVPPLPFHPHPNPPPQGRGDLGSRLGTLQSSCRERGLLRRFLILPHRGGGCKTRPGGWRAPWTGLRRQCARPRDQAPAGIRPGWTRPAGPEPRGWEKPSSPS